MPKVIESVNQDSCWNVLTRTFRKELSAMLIVGISSGLGWFVPESGVSVLVLGLAMLALGFLAPAWALVLLGLMAPRETVQQLVNLGSVFTTELMILAWLPGAVWNILANRAWQKTAIPIAAWLLPFTIFLVLSFLLHPAAITAKGALRWLEFLLVLVLATHVLRRGYEAERVVWGLVLAAIASAIWGIAETAGGVSAFPHGRIIVIQAGEVVRAGAGFGANTLAVYLAMFLPFALAAALMAPTGGKRAIGLLGSGILLAGFLATFSLTGWFALGVAGLVIWFYLTRYFPRLAVWGATLIIAGFVIWLLQHQEAVGGAFWKTKLQSFQDRFGYLQVTGELVKSSPWFGIGPGMYRFLAPRLWITGMNPIGLITHPHSLYLSIMVELGLAGLTGFFWAILRLCLWLASHLSKLPIGWPAAAGWSMTAGLAAFFSANLSEHCMIHDRGVHAALLLAASLVYVWRPSSYSPTRMPRHWFNRKWQHHSLVHWEHELKERKQGRKPLYAFLQQVLKGIPSARVLELGSGLALDSMMIARDFKAEVDVVDSSPAALVLAESGAKALQVKLHRHCQDVRKTGLESSFFDLVFSQGLLEHLGDPAPVWQEMYRCLKPGGYAIVDVPQTFHPYTLAKLWHEWRGDWPWGIETSFTGGDLAMQAQQHGFRVIARQGYGYRGGVLDVTLWLKKWLEPRNPAWWQWLEQQWGAGWMMNVVVLVQKK